MFTLDPFAPRVKYVKGPDGSPLTIADLPLPGAKGRWVARRKGLVVAAVRGGLLSLDEACSRYTLTVDEFLSWQSSIAKFGLAGLRSTRTQQYPRERRTPSRFGAGQERDDVWYGIAWTVTGGLFWADVTRATVLEAVVARHGR